MLVPRPESIQRWSVAMLRIDANIRTTPRIRREIQQAPASVSHRELARRYGIHRHAIAK
ncbi:tsr1347 [Thermosynechococcus vestitus BP-1]|uniref:Tsr1347 protein n=1 Tax=Thermosynechococcus vestitus (strain NIES-2133 / IAM M-273 / BP-1) TaxID=197221 RepID=Q8DJ81_THEVB|nr:tsr1347 [Thermosynechococcus vestitus BP-1]